MSKERIDAKLKAKAEDLTVEEISDTGFMQDKYETWLGSELLD